MCAINMVYITMQVCAQGSVRSCTCTVCVRKETKVTARGTSPVCVCVCVCMCVCMNVGVCDTVCVHRCVHPCTRMFCETVCK